MSKPKKRQQQQQKETKAVTPESCAAGCAGHSVMCTPAGCGACVDEETSGTTQPKKQKTLPMGRPTKPRCATANCDKGAVSGGTPHCSAHGGGKRCQMEGCNKGAVSGGTPHCTAHGGGRRCETEGCDKAAEGGGTRHCGAHGGGRRCETEGCDKGALSGGTPHCGAHGGGRRCETEGCDKGVHSGGTLHCIAHGGGRRCETEGCGKAVHSSSALCLQHACPGCSATPVPAEHQRLCAVHRSDALTQELLDAGGVDASPASLAFKSIGPEEETILRAVSFSSISATGVAEQLTQEQLEVRVRVHVADALTQAAHLGGWTPLLTASLLSDVQEYHRTALQRQTLMTVSTLEVASTEGHVLRATLAAATEGYSHLLPQHLCPRGVSPISDGTISAHYASYARPVGAGCVVRQPYGHPSVSVWAEPRCQMLIRRTLLNTTGASICMAALPRRLLQLVDAAESAAGAGQTVTMQEGSPPVAVEQRPVEAVSMVGVVEVAEAEAGAAMLAHAEAEVAEVVEVMEVAAAALLAAEQVEAAAVLAAEVAEEASEVAAVAQLAEAAAVEAGEAVVEARAAAAAAEDALVMATQGRMDAEEVARLNVQLYTLSSSEGRLRFGLPSLDQLVERGLAVRAPDGGLTIPIRLGPRVSTQPGTMGTNNEPQRLASALDDAASQRLQLPTARALGPQARAFNMCPERLATGS